MSDLRTKMTSRGLSLSTYAEVECSDSTVAHFASLGLTLREIAALFTIEESTLIKHHIDAFHAGKAQMKAKPRIILFNHIRTLNEKFAEQLETVGQFALDENGNEIRIAVDTKLGKLLLDYLAQANRLIPQEVNLNVTKNQFAELTDEELEAKIQELKAK